MNKTFLGYPNQKIIEEIKRRNKSTEDGIWFIPNTKIRVLDTFEKIDDVTQWSYESSFLRYSNVTKDKTGDWIMKIVPKDKSDQCYYGLENKESTKLKQIRLKYYDGEKFIDDDYLDCYWLEDDSSINIFQNSKWEIDYSISKGETIHDILYYDSKNNQWKNSDNSLLLYQSTEISTQFNFVIAALFSFYNITPGYSRIKYAHDFTWSGKSTYNKNLLDITATWSKL